MIQVAHSPDADDIFMYYAIAFGWIDSALGLKFSNIAKDIQTLNHATLQEIYDVSAISFALYPLVADNYALLRTGVSFGKGYGPKLIKKRGKALKHNFKVALSGAHTTNAMLFRIAYPNARIVYKNFLEIESCVLQDEVDAGVLIHESILDFSSELEVEREIWDIWCDLTKEELPLPLGGMVLRRSIPLTKALDIEDTLTQAVRIATQNKPLLSQMLLERSLIRVDSAKLDTYLSLYANTESISLSTLQIRAIDTLFEIGYQHKIYPKALRCEEFMIPREYKDLRHS